MVKVLKRSIMLPRLWDPSLFFILGSRKFIKGIILYEIDFVNMECLWDGVLIRGDDEYYESGSASSCGFLC